MAEESQGQEKTEEATQRKKNKAREEGQVARSRELNTMVLVIMGALGLMAVVPWGADRIMALTQRIIQMASIPDDNFMDVLGLATTETLLVIVPLLAIMFAAGVGSSVLTGGFVLSSKAIAFKGERMSPLKGFKRMFSAKSLVELVKSIAKFVLISGVAILTLSYLLHDVLNIGRLAIEPAIGHGLSIVAVALLLIGSALVLVAVIDVPFQMAQHKKQLKMTKQEVKDEMKDTEGKPEVRARIRQAQQEIARRRMLEDVPHADVVITNPEHFSVAIKYDAMSMEAPLVIAKGADLVAFRIREVAAANDVPIMPVPSLARAVYYAADIGQEVPAGLYVAVAQVLAYVYQLRQFQAGQGVAPSPLGAVDVPPEFEVERES